MYPTLKFKSFFCRAINDRAEEIKNITKGKEDDKVYRGLNYYNQYIDKKESLIGRFTGACAGFFFGVEGFGFSLGAS